MNLETRFTLTFSSKIDGSMINTKVLLIDDDADLLQLASVIFKKEGAQVMTARDGMEGIS